MTRPAAEQKGILTKCKCIPNENETQPDDVSRSSRSQSYLVSMKILNVELKARCDDAQRIRDILTAEGAQFVGKDHQVDTYYATPHGRLKLRCGNIENALIAYARENVNAPKRSEVLLYKTHNPSGLQQILDTSMQRLVVVDKLREIYFIENVKFHLDQIQDLGTFIEIEAIDETGKISEEVLRNQVVQYKQLLRISDESLLTHSYSDMILDIA